MYWKDEKQRAENSTKELNKYAKVANDARLNPVLEQYEVKITGKRTLWKTIYRNEQNISEEFKTWREVAIFLSGFRKALMI